MRRALFLGILAALGAGLGVLASSRTPSERPAHVPETPDRREREVSGSVLLEGAPVPGARVELFEMGPEGPFPGPRAVAGANGGFRISWTPAVAADGRAAYLLVRHEAHPPVVAPAAASPVTVRLGRAVAVSGRVLAHDGTPLPGARVAVALRDQPSRAPHATTDAEGAFSLPGFCEGAPVDIAVTHAARPAWIERRFRAGEPVTLRPLPSAEARLRVRTPSGAPVAGARASLPAPFALRPHLPFAETDAEGRASLPGASGAPYVEVSARGFVPVHVDAPAQVETEVVLWPAREVDLTVWDSISAAGVEAPWLEIEPLLPPDDLALWWGPDRFRVEPRYPARPGRASGAFRIALPACPCEILASAAGYLENTVAVSADRTRAGLPMRPLARARGARLRLRPLVAEGAFEGSLPLVLLDERTGWNATVVLVPGGAEAEVPPRAAIQIASMGAADGHWAPKQEVQTPEAGALRAIDVGLRPAIRVAVQVRGEAEGPAPAGSVSLVDVAMADFGPPARAPLENGRAVLWARPKRALRVEVEVRGDYFPLTRGVDSATEDVELTLAPLRAAALEVQVTDGAGAPIPFARVRLWPPEAARAGAPDLWAAPLQRRTDAWGRARLAGIDEGEGALEVAAEGFRSRRVARVELGAGAVVTLPPIRLDPAPWRRGRLVDYRGEPVAGARLAVLHPGVARLPVRGLGDHDTFDPDADDAIQVSTGPDGAFELPDESPGSPVWWIRPAGRPDLSPAAILPPEEGDTVRLPALARVGVHVPGTVFGIYAILPGGRAVLLYRDPPMANRPVSLRLPAGRTLLHARLRDGRSATFPIDLRPEEERMVAPDFR